ncbi:MAG TPA: NAD-dependent succinate-semialdehyde dehydrogenase [Thermodesulfobacteriota bacterium]
MAQTERLLIGGEWVEAASKAVFEVTNPATGDVIAKVADAGREETRQAIHAAARAFPEWSGATAKTRADALTKACQLMLERKEELARLMTTEQGKPLAEARGEVVYAAGFLEWYAGEAVRVYGETIPASVTTKRLVVLRQPIGVVAAITPWNFPSAMITRKIAPALAAGCTVVVKPAEQTPLSALALGRIFLEAGFPPGVVNIVTSRDPREVGAELLSNPIVRKVTFTGSTEVGKLLMRQAADQVKKVSLELGGHAPFIVFEDADLDAAADGAVASKFRNMGQTCVCANRLYVHRSVVDAFTRKFTERVAKLKMGNGLEEGVQVGPLIDEQGFKKVEAHVADAVAQGAVVLLGGKPRRDGAFAKGYFYEPTVLTGVKDSMRIMKEETFGPVAPIEPFDTEDEVIRKANDTPYGLAAYFYSRDVGRVWRVAERLEYGIVGANDALPSVPQAPFGGWKESGIGREGGREGMEPFLETKYVSMGGI